MIDPADQPAYRHPVVYRTVRGLRLSGGREAAGTVHSALQPPLRASETVRVRRGTDTDTIDAGATPGTVSVQNESTVQDDSAGLYELRRYSEPND